MHRQTYALRRLRDAGRLLPVLGAACFAFPVLWVGDVQTGIRTAQAGIYLFAVWFALILLAAVLSRRLLAKDAPPPPHGPGEAPAPAPVPAPEVR